jgi:hypothetical protein
MNCVEFERVLLEGERTPEQQAHLDSCSACANLLADFNLISSKAKLLLACDEPSPAVWNALEARLRSEGLIRSGATSQSVRIDFFDFFRHWRAAWLVPVAAVLVIVTMIRLHHPVGAGDNGMVAKQSVAKTAPIAPPIRAAASHDDQQLLDSVASRPPAQLAKYRADLDNANAFIRDAQQAVKNDPNDVYRQQMLINAYEQKEMLYDLAVDRVSEQ